MQRNHPSRLPLSQKISRAIYEAIERGEITAGTKLPSIRKQARQLGVSPYTIVTAYDHLVATGLVASRLCSGFYVQDPRRVMRERM